MVCGGLSTTGECFGQLDLQERRSRCIEFSDGVSLNADPFTLAEFFGQGTSTFFFTVRPTLRKGQS